MKQARKVEICGRVYTVFECAEDAPELDGAEGVCDYNGARIFILGDHAEEVKIDTLVHEILHAVIEATGLKTRFTEADEGLEETFITTCTGALRGALKSAGWREPKRVGKAPRKPRAKAAP